MAVPDTILTCMLLRCVREKVRVTCSCLMYRRETQFGPTNLWKEQSIRHELTSHEHWGMLMPHHIFRWECENLPDFVGLKPVLWWFSRNIIRWSRCHHSFHETSWSFLVETVCEPWKGDTTAQENNYTYWRLPMVKRIPDRQRQSDCNSPDAGSWTWPASSWKPNGRITGWEDITFQRQITSRDIITFLIMITATN